MAYIYRHIRLDINEPFYIGIGSDKNFKRAFDKFSRNRYWNFVVNKTPYEVEILMDNLTWEQAQEKEKEFIALYGRKDLGKGNLVNLTDGGDGSFGVKVKESTRKKISEIHKGNTNTKGRKHTEEAKIKISIAQIGRKLSDDWKKNISDGHKGKKKSQEHKNKLAEASRGNKNNFGNIYSEEARRKISEASKRYWEKNRGKKCQSPKEETKRKISESLKLYFKNKKRDNDN